MKEDDPTTNQSTPSNKNLEITTFQNHSQMSESQASRNLKTKAYKVKKWRENAKKTAIR